MKRNEFLERRNRHLNAIASVYGGWADKDTDLDYVWRSWRRTDLKLHYLAELMCNCDNERRTKRAEKEFEQITERFAKRTAKLFRYHKKFASQLYINYDPRGYQLKLDFPQRRNCSIKEWRKLTDIHMDWGQYGILAPDFTDNWD